MKMINNGSLVGSCLWIVGHVARPAVTVLADGVHTSLSNESTVQSNSAFTENFIKAGPEYSYRSFVSVGKVVYAWKGMLDNLSSNKMVAGGTALVGLVPVSAVAGTVAFFPLSILHGVALQ